MKNNKIINVLVFHFPSIHSTYTQSEKYNNDSTSNFWWCIQSFLFLFFYGGGDVFRRTKCAL